MGDAPRAARVALREWDGALVPQIWGYEGPDLRAAGAEVLDQEDGSVVVYTQQYSEEEQLRRAGGVEGFHAGFSLLTFFQAFPALLEHLDWQTTEMLLPFLEADVVAFLMSSRPG